MGPAGREHLNKCPERKKAKVAHYENKQKKTKTGHQQHDIAAIITGIMHAQRDATAEVPQHSGA